MTIAREQNDVSFLSICRRSVLALSTPPWLHTRLFALLPALRRGTTKVIRTSKRDVPTVCWCSQKKKNQIQLVCSKNNTCQFHRWFNKKKSRHFKYANYIYSPQQRRVLVLSIVCGSHIEQRKRQVGGISGKLRRLATLSDTRFALASIALFHKELNYPSLQRYLSLRCSRILFFFFFSKRLTWLGMRRCYVSVVLRNKCLSWKSTFSQSSSIPSVCRFFLMRSALLYMR